MGSLRAIYANDMQQSKDIMLLNTMIFKACGIVYLRIKLTLSISKTYIQIIFIIWTQDTGAIRSTDVPLIARMTALFLGCGISQLFRHQL